MPYRPVFARNPGSFGPPDNPNPLGFLALLQAGRDIWNAWRAAHPTAWDQTNGVWRRALKFIDDDVRQNVQLSAYPALDFTGMHLGDGADFTGQRFSNDSFIRFDEAEFGEDAKLESIIFSNGASFSGTRFGRGARLVNVRIEQRTLPASPNWARFDGATFGDGAILDTLQFWWPHSRTGMPEVSFRACKFGSEVRLHIALLNPQFERVYFDDTSFGDDADLSYASFGDFASFHGCNFGMRTSFMGAQIDAADFGECRFGPDIDFRGEEFGLISFKAAYFQGSSNFSNRRFTARTGFGKVRFGTVPLFHNCELHQDTEFDDDSFPKKPEGTGEASRAYRTLKLAMSKHQATREEQFFFRREMREERVELWRVGGLQKRLRSVLYGLYGVLSDYGASVRVPALWFLFCLVIFAAIYAGLSKSAALWLPGRTFDATQTVNWLTYSVVNSLPLGGLEEASKDLRKMLFPNETGTAVLIAIVIQKALSLVFLFLIGLALRNIFKMK